MSGVRGTPSGDPICTRYPPEHFRCPNTIVLYINLYLSTISRLLVMYVISSGTPNNIRSPNHITHIILNHHRTLRVRNLRVRELCRHDRDTSPVNNQLRKWMLILAPIYSMKMFIGRTVMATYVIPFVIGMLLARDSIIGIFIPSSISLPESLFTRSVMRHPTTNSLVKLLARLLMMCITERAQRYLSDNWSDKS